MISQPRIMGVFLRIGFVFLCCILLIHIYPVARSQYDQHLNNINFNYDNDEIWNEDISMNYGNNHSLTTGLTDCTRKRAISWSMPANGTISWSWRTNDAYGSFNFYLNNINKPQLNINYIDGFSPLKRYHIAKGDKIVINYTRESFPCTPGQGWLFVDYIPDEIIPNQTIINPIITNRTIPNQTISNQTISNQTISNQTISNQTISNQTISNQTISNQTISNQTISNQTISNQTISNQTISKVINIDANDIKFYPTESEFIRDNGYIILEIHPNSKVIENVDIEISLSEGVEINNEDSSGFLKGIHCVTENNSCKCNNSNIINQDNGTMDFTAELRDNAVHKISLNKIILNNDLININKSYEFECHEGVCYSAEQ